jgi:ATP-dependent DNA helicase RecQ
MRAPFTQDTWKEVDAAAARLGVTTLRAEQRQVVKALCEGHDALVVLPAGIGKSTAVLIAAQLLRQPVVVVSPLVSLLRAEHDRLLQRRIPGVRVDASIHGAERRQALTRIAAGGSLVVLTTPDGFADDELVGALSRSGVALVAVEEAHTVSEWAHQFRPASARLGEQLWRLGPPPVAALTSTATTETRHDIADRLGLRSPAVFESAPHRENIALDVIEARGEVRQRALVSLVMRLRRPGIIYCATPHDVEAVYGALRALRIPAHRYHGEMSAGERGGEQLNFMVPGRRTVMVATSGFTPTTGIAGLGEIGRLDLTPSGFGLGVQKRDVRFVIHYQAPASLEQYVREIGLAGRDDEAATCVMFHEPGDRSRNETLLSRIRVRPRHVAALAEALESYAHEGRPATVEALALAAGQSHKNAELLSAVLADAGLATLSSGWVRPRVPGPTLLEETRRLASRLSTLERQDAKRLAAVADYAASRQCRSLFLGRYFGVLRQAPCKRCGVCAPAEHAIGNDASEPARRPPVREFSVSYAGSAYTDRDHRSSPLTAKLGDFAR